MTNKEAKMFLDNLKICIDEHPVVADWLVEIADRKTEPSGYKMKPVEQTEPQTECETCKHNKLEWFSEKCDECSKAHSNYEPQTERIE
jgi:Zn finger protein HypA/HybF involved in hydrogenase expression